MRTNIYKRKTNMKNNLFELSEEEKNNIRTLHESYKSKPGTSLNEQGGRVSGIGFEPGNLNFGRTTKSQSGQLSPKDAELPKDDVGFLDPNDSEDVKYASQLINNTKSVEYKRIQIFIENKLKDSNSKKTFKKLKSTQPITLLNIANKIQEISGEDPKDVRVIAQQVVIEDLGEKVISSAEKPGEPAKIDYLEFPYPETPGLTSDFFPNNSWTPTQDFANYVQTQIVEPIKTVVEQAITETNQKPTLFLQYMNVDSSVSRFRNTITNSGEPIPTGTENADRMSFETLSNKRANASIEYIKNALSPYINIGDPMSWNSSVIKINDKGTNGDGSSGPDPYKEAEKLVKSKQYPDIKTAFEDKTFTGPYKIYRYTKLNFSIGVIPINVAKPTEPTPPKPGDVIKENNYKFLFFYEETDWDFTFKLPRLRLKYTSSAKKIGPFTVNRQDCNISWWERITGKFFNPGSKGF